MVWNKDKIILSNINLNISSNIFNIILNINNTKNTFNDDLL